MALYLDLTIDFPAIPPYDPNSHWPIPTEYHPSTNNSIINQQSITKQQSFNR